MKWTALHSFTYARLKAKSTVVKGITVLHMKHERRTSFMTPWKHNGDEYTIVNSKGYLCQSEAEIPAMVERYLKSKTKLTHAHH